MKKTEAESGCSEEMVPSFIKFQCSTSCTHIQAVKLGQVVGQCSVQFSVIMGFLLLFFSFCELLMF